MEKNKEKQSKLLELAIRSYARSKICYSEIGESEESETQYIREQDARVFQYKLKKQIPYALILWRESSMYGTDLKRWSKWVLATILFLGIVYQLLHSAGLMEAQRTTSDWTFYWSGVFYALSITSSLGMVDFFPQHWTAQALVIANVIWGYFLLGIGIGIVTRLIKGR